MFNHLMHPRLTVKLTTIPILVQLLADNPKEIPIHCSTIQLRSIGKNTKRIQRMDINSTPGQQTDIIITTKIELNAGSLPKTCTGL